MSFIMITLLYHDVFIFFYVFVDIMSHLQRRHNKCRAVTYANMENLNLYEARIQNSVWYIFILF
jgi:hypothetical protein